MNRRTQDMRKKRMEWNRKTNLQKPSGTLRNSMDYLLKRPFKKPWILSLLQSFCPPKPTVSAHTVPTCTSFSSPAASTYTADPNPFWYPKCLVTEDWNTVMASKRTTIDRWLQQVIQCQSKQQPWNLSIWRAPFAWWWTQFRSPTLLLLRKEWKCKHDWLWDVNQR